MKSRRTQLLMLLVFLMVAIAAAPAGAQAYKVTLKNGNTFLAKYKPEEATYDSSKMVLMTDVGNTIALAKDDIAEVQADLEYRGFGIVLDQTTIVIGFSANDNPVPGEEGDENTQVLPGQNPFQGLIGASFTTPGFPDGGFFGNAPDSGGLIGEPNSGGGIPLGFATGTGQTTFVPFQPVEPPND